MIRPDHTLTATSEKDGHATAVRQFVRRIASQVEATGYRSGGLLTTATMETATSSRRLNLACRRAYGRLLGAFAENFRAAGFSPQRAAPLATFVVSADEDGIILRIGPGGVSGQRQKPER